MRRAAKWLGWILWRWRRCRCCCWSASTRRQDSARIEGLTPRVTGDTVRIAGLSGRFPDGCASPMSSCATQGPYATIEDWRSTGRRCNCCTAHRDRPAGGGARRGDTDADRRLPAARACPSVVLREFRVARLDMARLGRRPGHGRAGWFGRNRHPHRFQREPNVRQISGEGSYSSPPRPTARAEATLHAGEPPKACSQPWPDYPTWARAIDAKSRGPREAVVTRTLCRRPHAPTVGGTLDLEREAAT